MQNFKTFPGLKSLEKGRSGKSEYGGEEGMEWDRIVPNV